MKVQHGLLQTALRGAAKEPHPEQIMGDGFFLKKIRRAGLNGSGLPAGEAPSMVGMPIAIWLVGSFHQNIAPIVQTALVGR
jgi:hypothetical protein